MTSASSSMLKSSTVSSLSLPRPSPSSPSPSLPFLHFNEPAQFTTTATTTWRKRWTPQTQLRVSSSEGYQTVVEDVAPPPRSSEGGAAEVVRRFYERINCHDLVSVEELIAENCVYEDLIFPQPFVGRKAILEFFKKFNDSISTDLQFVIDDISKEDSLAVGVSWHLEWKGKPFPFSKGCSFYRLEVVNGKRQIIYGRDSVEPAFKPAESALAAIRAVTWLLQQFPQLADQL